MISADSGEIVAEYVRPLNEAYGAGCSSTRGWSMNSPWYSMTPVSRASRMASADSLNCWRAMAMSVRKPSNSILPVPRPRPRIRRPCDIWSSMMICSAARTGSCHGRTSTIEPSFTVLVRPAM